MFFTIKIAACLRRMQRFQAAGVLPLVIITQGGEKMDKTIPYFAHEGIVARMERANRRLWILCIVLILLLTGTNGAWIYYESQFADETLTVTQDSPDGINNFIGNDGDITNGATNGDP